MLKLRKYLKPFIVGIFVSIILLFVQAICDLNLPNYMSDIVNVGVQQGGVESGVPDVISEEGYNFITSFMNEEDKLLMANFYEIKSSDDLINDDTKYSDLYDNSENIVFYGLKQYREDIDAENLATLESTIGKSIWTMQGVIQSLMEQGAIEAQLDAEEEDSSAAMDLSEMYKMQPMLSIVPQEIMQKSIEEAEKTDDMMLSQGSIMMVSAFHKELGADTEKVQSDYILQIGASMLLISLVSGLSTVTVTFMSSRIAAGVAKNLRNDIFKKTMNFSNKEYDKFSTSSLITRTTNDVIQVQTLLTMLMRVLIYAPILGIGGIIMAIRKSASMAWIIALAVIVLLGLILVILVTVIPRFKRLQKLVDRVNLVSRETLNGLMVIRAFGQGNFEKKRFNVANNDLTNETLKINRVMALLMPIMMFIMQATSLLVIWIGSEQVAQSTMQVGDMMAFMQYATQVIMAFLMVSMIFVFIPRASVSATRIFEVLDTEPSIKDPINSKKLDESKMGVVEFKNVSFKYEGASEDVLNDINFTANPGETTAFIGSTGSGKTTLINLIPRFFDVTEGEIIVNGVDVRDVTQHDLRERIGYVPQKSILMSGTIKSNIAYGESEAEDEDVVRAAKIAQAIEFISSKEDGMDSEISQGGTNVSGGQRQRLSIARALAIRPDIFIFDDSFSALDYKTDAALRKALKENTGNSTVIIVAQRVSTIMEADQIFVLDSGKIVGRGTHKELLKSCEQYYEIASSQLSKEELENE